jgi:LCP family protein required for cell wall assembly
VTQAPDAATGGAGAAGPSPDGSARPPATRPLRRPGKAPEATDKTVENGPEPPGFATADNPRSAETTRIARPTAGPPPVDGPPPADGGRSAGGEPRGGTTDPPGPPGSPDRGSAPAEAEGATAMAEPDEPPDGIGPAPWPDYPDGDEPPIRRGRSLAARLLGVLAALVSATIMIVSVSGYVFYHQLDGRVTRIHLNLGGALGGSSSDGRPAGAPAGTENFLLVGSDSRAGTGSEYQSSGAVTGERSDTTMLAHLDANGTTTLVSFPRDTVVNIPGHGRDKLNAAISIGGPQLLIQTLEKLTDIRIDHFVSIDLAGFKAMTDAIGGVTVCVAPLPGGSTSNLHDVYSRWSGHVGANTLDGEQALSFVRQRYGLPGGDFDRIRRQQQFISAVFHKASSTGVLTSPTRLDALLNAAASALTVDEGTSVDDLRKLATRMRGMDPASISFETIPVHPPTAADSAELPSSLRRASVQIYDPTTLEKFLAPIRGHSDTATPAVTPLPPSQVRVAVANGTHTSGLATRAASELRRAGFAVTGITTSDSRGVTQSEIHYNAGLVAAAEALAAAVPDADLVEDHAADPVLTLVLGSSFAGVADASGSAAGAAGAASAADPDGATSPGAAATGATPTPTPTASTAAQLTQRCTY